MVETGCEADREPEIEASVATGRGWIHGGQQWLLASPQLLASLSQGSQRKGTASIRPRLGAPEFAHPSFDVMANLP